MNLGKLKPNKKVRLLTVGGMGHACSIATGISIARPKSKVFCLDGDGALLMHSGALANTSDKDNFIHIILNNEAHDSVGGQPTKGDSVNFQALAKAFGYKNTLQCNTKEEINKLIPDVIKLTGSVLIEVKCRKGFRKELGRPDTTPIKNKLNFLKSMEEI